MNVKRFTGRTSREAMQKVKAAFGDDAVVLSTKPCAEGVEILAMADGSVASIERLADESSERLARPAPAARTAAAPAAQPEDEITAESVGEDVKRLAMSTLSFQDYVRERLLNKRRAAAARQAHQEPSFAPSEPAWGEPAAPARTGKPAAGMPATSSASPAPTLAQTLGRAAPATSAAPAAPRVFDPSRADEPAAAFAAPSAAPRTPAAARA